ncbi:hypothetical protein JQ589_16365 [Bradyrhizobium japonicum]|nr:hypothetical protein [Bradyrhizobium japonicum]
MTCDPAKDFRMLSLMTDVPLVMEVNSTLPVKSVKEFVEYAKKNPGKLFFGSADTGRCTWRERCSSTQPVRSGARNHLQ